MTRPSWQDFGTHDESAYPQLWDGVVGAWCPSLGPTGLRLHDHSRRNNWGTLTNMDAATDWTVSGGQYALDFDGTNDYVVTSSGVPVASAVLSVSLWIWRRDTPTTFPRLVDLSDGTHSVQAVFDTGVSLGGSGFFVTKHSQYQAGTTGTQWGFVPTLQTWEHIAIIFNGVTSTTRVWRDGAEQTGAANNFVGAATATNTLVFGARRDLNAVTQLDGQLDDIAIYTRALSANEIQQLYLLGRGGMYERRRRTLRRVAIEQAGFRAYWARRNSQIIGGGV